MSHSSRRINSLAKRLIPLFYRDVELCGGVTFSLIEMQERTGVDPNFCFDPDTMLNASTRLMGETTDMYFAKLTADVT